MKTKTIRHLSVILFYFFIFCLSMSSFAQQKIVIIDSTFDGTIKFAKIIPDTSSLMKQNNDNE